MAITITGPLATPAPTLTASAGGDATMTAGTYDVAVACANTSSYSLLVADQRRSAAWIGQITITAGQKINVSYPAVPSATHYNIYIKKSTETWYGGNRRVGTSDTAATTALLTLDITTLNSRRPHFDTFSYDTTYFTPPIALNTGTVVMHISGTDMATYYYADLYNAMVAAGLSAYIAYDKGEFWFKGQIIVDAGATGALAWYNLKTVSDIALNTGVHLLQGIVVNNSNTFTMTWGTTQRGAVLYQECWSWNIDTKNMDCTCLTILAGNWQKLRAQIYLWGGDHYLIAGANTGSTENMTLKGCNVQNQKNGGVLSGISSNSSILASFENTTTKNCSFESYGLTTNRTGYAILRESTVGNTGFARHVRSRNSMSQGIRFINVKWRNNNTIIPTAGGEYLERPEIYWESGAAGLVNIFYQANPVKIKIVDENNLPVSGATVHLRNLTKSTSPVNESTNASGETTEVDVDYEEGQYDGSGVYGNGTGSDYSWKHTNWTVYNFRLTISKAGYETYEQDFTFKNPQYLTIKIKPSTIKRLPIELVDGKPTLNVGNIKL
jgi:hypothetical protein